MLFTGTPIKSLRSYPEWAIIKEYCYSCLLNYSLRYVFINTLIYSFNMKKLIIGALLALPTVTFAQTLGGVTSLAESFGELVTLLIPIVMGLAVLVFFWGLVKYISSTSDESSKLDGKNLMIWGMIALFVMVALWGILGWFQAQLGLTGTIDPGTAPIFTVPGV
jgi:uncharacterized membrane protein YidH (DUF202 family)